MNPGVSVHLDQIQSVFREVQEKSAASSDAGELVSLLNHYPEALRPVAWEAASMQIALRDLEQNDELKFWKETLLGHPSSYAVTFHMGLGWALAQLQRDPSDIIQTLEPMLRYRVADGYGYYEGLFRKRKSIMSLERPDFMDPYASRAYDQGLGRSIWLHSKGDTEMIAKMTAVFDPSRLPDLWRGIGIACTFVGGADNALLTRLWEMAAQFQPQLGAAAVMVAFSQHSAGYFTSYLNDSCQAWLKQNPINLVTDFVSKDNSASNAYAVWVEWLEEQFDKQNRNYSKS